MQSVSLGFSPCPNDTFIFYAMVHGRIETEGLAFNELLLDVETLNQKALNTELDVTKVSYHALGHLRDDYCLLRSGGALGRGCGPLVVSKHVYAMHELRDRKIAVPGKLTTAYMLLQLYDPSFRFDPDRIIVMPFDRIMKSVVQEEVDAGLIIHESRFTFASHGLKKIIDLGEWWEGETGYPIPLGGIIARRSLGIELINKLDSLVRRSVSYAFKNRDETMSYIKQHSQELSDKVINQHIDLYVNDYSIEMREEGERAVREFLSRAEHAGVVPLSDQSIFP